MILIRRASALLVLAMVMALEAVAWAGISAGQQVGVDISDAYGAATNWTLLLAVGGGSVNARDLASGNVVPGVTVALSASTGGGGVNDLSGTAQGNSITTAPHTVTDDGAWAYDGGGTTLSLTFAGLDPALVYRIELYSIGTYTPLDTPFINGIATNWPAGFETRALRKSQTTGAIYSNLVAVGGTLSIGVREVNPVLSGAILTAVAVTPPIVSQAVNTTNWSRTVAMQSIGYAGTSPLPNFPLLVTLNPTNISGFSYVDFVPGGRDLRFTDASNTVVLPHEIEAWNSNGVSLVWVRVPSLTSNTVLRAFWGNPDAPALGLTNRVWDEGFRGVWHLASGFADSTTNANQGTNSATVSSAGVVAQGRSFDGNAYIDCGNRACLNLTNNQLTLSAWINPSQISGNVIIGKSYNPTHVSPWYTWILYAYPSGLHCRLDNTTVTAGALTSGQWQHVAATYDGSMIRLYVNGQYVGGTPKSGNLQPTARDVRIGGRDTSDLGEFYYGILDEVRVSAVARSADWIRAERDTVVNEAFCRFGDVLPTQPLLPLVANPLGATNLLATSATLTGLLVSTGAAPSSVWFCWGESDAGTNYSAWSHHTALGLCGTGPFSAAVTGLVPETVYFYRCRATNTYGEAWSGAQAFTAFAPRLSVADAQVVEGSSGQTTMRFIATLSAAYPESISFDYSTAPGSASPSDFQAVSGQATFLPGQTQLFIDVMINGNTVPQSDRYFFLSLSNSQIALITKPQAMGLILDDDRGTYLSPNALVTDTNRARLYVAEQSASRVVVVNLNTDTLVQTFTVPDAPSGLALSPDGTRLYVA
ncbi:MAG: DUF2341 domain-containing protein, partial [Verrucomicrobia bacterium]|nr:DUF2341 domain-containing protein [Verrucomicrobiota bacterium]